MDRVVLKFVVWAVILSIGIGGAALGCPLCAEQTEALQEESGVNVALGYSLSILFMLLVPFGLVGGLGWALYRNYRHMQATGPQIPPKRHEMCCD